MKMKMTLAESSLETNRLPWGAAGRKLCQGMLAGVLAFAVISCSSAPYVSTGSRVSPAEEGREATGGPSGADLKGDRAGGQGGPASPSHMSQKRPEEPSDGSRRSGTQRPKGGPAQADGNGDEVLFRDLPGIEIDERSLDKRTTVGNDALIEKELTRLLREFGEDKEVGTIFLNEVKLYVKAFQTNEQYRKFMTSSLRRSAQYMPAVKEVFRKRYLPEDMAYIAFLESGFNPRARSRAGALGMWQFMPDTARRYSLKVAGRIDERLDPVKSTYAAVEYFLDLIAIFGPRSFLLALAAYNAGEGRIIGCLRKLDNPMEQRDFWHIRSCLAQETREYPPKIVAAAVIGSNPEVFGFPRFDAGNASKEMLIAFADQRLPEEATPTALPAPRPADTSKSPAKIHKKEVLVAAAKGPARKPVIYVVKRYNSLSGVADMFGVEETQIKRWNKLKSNRLVAGRKLTIYPPVALEPVRYTVRRGDTITDICRSFQVRPVSVVQANGLKNGWAINAGQHLVLYRAAKKKPVIYTVKRGDSLASISNKFNVSPKDIMKWNDMKGSHVHARQKLKVYAP